MSEKNIVLCGFMGTGKTTVGRLLAARLGRRFFDLDAVLVDHFGRSIAEVFEAEGEAFFREAEALHCQRLSVPQGLVIATGGGAVLSEANREALARGGRLVCLHADIAELLERLQGDDTRPLLRSDDREALARLLAARREVYDGLPNPVETRGRSPEEVCEGVLAALGMDSEVVIGVKAPTSRYDICVNRGLLSDAGGRMRARGLGPCAALVVTNPVVGAHYQETLMASLRDAGFAPGVCVVPDGEQHKTLDTVREIYQAALAMGLSRSDVIVALGGGVVGDMAGFAAATYMRGVSFVQIPTSLLAMVDASVGGKTGVDLPEGKNLVGAFKQPHVVLIDPTVLSTLAIEELRSGMAEVIKQGLLGAPALFEQLEAGGIPDERLEMVAAAVRVKVEVVERDPFERLGQRALLNLGHTFGHALELVSGFALRHGEAVGLGLIAATRLAVSMGRANAALETRVRGVIERVGLPVEVHGLDLDAVLDAMAHDKKKPGRKLRFIIPERVGAAAIVDDPGRALVGAALAPVLGGGAG